MRRIYKQLSGGEDTFILSSDMADALEEFAREMNLTPRIIAREVFQIELFENGEYRPIDIAPDIPDE